MVRTQGYFLAIVMHRRNGLVAYLAIGKARPSSALLHVLALFIIDRRLLVSARYIGMAFNSWFRLQDLLKVASR